MKKSHQRALLKTLAHPLYGKVRKIFLVCATLNSEGYSAINT